MIPDISRVIRESDGLSLPRLERACFDDAFLSDADLLAILRHCAENSASSPWPRVFVDGGQRADLVSKIIASPPSSDDSLESWSKRVFGASTFGVILDRPPLHDDAFAARLGALLAELARSYGLPLGGFEPHLFVGNYGFTPFGIHKDKEDGAVLHFHLGPHAKRMTLWSPEAYERLTGSRAAHFDPAPLISGGASFEIQRGDLFVLPTSFFHVGFTPKLSAALAVAIVDLDAASWLETLMQTLTERICHEREGALLPRAAPTLRQGPLAPALADLCRSVGAQRLDRALAECALDRQGMLHSNLGLVPPAPLRSEQWDLAPSDRLRRCGPFPLQARRNQEDGMVLYVRGHRLELTYSEAFERLLARLNEGSQHSVDELLAYLADEWEQDAARFVIELLWRHRGLERC